LPYSLKFIYTPMPAGVDTIGLQKLNFLGAELVVILEESSAKIQCARGPNVGDLQVVITGQGIVFDLDCTSKFLLW